MEARFGNHEDHAGLGNVAAMCIRTFYCYIFLKVNIWVIFLYTTKTTKEKKGNMLKFKFICHWGFSFLQYTLQLLFTRKEGTTLKMLSATKICETTFLNFYEATEKLFLSCQLFLKKKEKKEKPIIYIIGLPNQQR